MNKHKFLPRCGMVCAALLTHSVGAAPMEGFPPPPDMRVTKANAFTAPYLRWSASHAREVSPTRAIRRAATPVPLAAGGQASLGTTQFEAGERGLSVDDYLRDTVTDGFIVLHRGQVVYQRTFDGFEDRQPHIWASMTKSVTGLLATQLMAEGKLAPAAKLAQYVPELAGTPFGEATVQQNLDMQVPVAYPADVPPDLGLFAAAGLIPRKPGMPEDIYSFLKVAQTVPGSAPLFFYQNGSPEALAWAMRRITGQSWAALVSERIWSRFAEDDAYVQVDALGTEMASGGISASLRDTARFAELLRQTYAAPTATDSFSQAVRGLFEGEGTPERFAKGNLAPGRPGYGYHNYWFRMNDGDGSIQASGRFGQRIYINPRQEVVIVKLSATPDQAPRATTAEGGPNVAARAVDSNATFDAMARAVAKAVGR